MVEMVEATQPEVFPQSVLAGVLSGVVAYGCGPEAHAPPRDTEAECPPGSELTFESFGRGFFEAHCDRCHAGTVTGTARMGAPAPITFDDVASVRERLARIDRQSAGGPAAVNELMPPSAPFPTVEERYRLGEWLACGAP